MQNIELRELLEAGVHFGHEVKRWHPKAASFIYSARNKIHIIDLIKTKEALTKACEYARNLGLSGKKLLFVGTKRQARQIVQSEAQRIKTCFFSKRWIGGFITNWYEIKKNIDKLNKMDADKQEGKWQKFRKHEQLKFDRERMLLEKFYGGVKMLQTLPDALFIVDIRKESSTIAEARQFGIPMIGVVDTNSNPDLVDYPVPGNDDAVKSITYLVTKIASAYEEGLLEFNKKFQETKKVLPPKTAEKVNPIIPEAKVKKTRAKKETKVKKPAIK